MENDFKGRLARVAEMTLQDATEMHHKRVDARVRPVLMEKAREQVDFLPDQVTFDIQRDRAFAMTSGFLEGMQEKVKDYPGLITACYAFSEIITKELFYHYNDLFNAHMCRDALRDFVEHSIEELKEDPSFTADIEAKLQQTVAFTDLGLQAYEDMRELIANQTDNAHAGLLTLAYELAGEPLPKVDAKGDVAISPGALENAHEFMESVLDNLAGIVFPEGARMLPQYYALASLAQQVVLAEIYQKHPADYTLTDNDTMAIGRRTFEVMREATEKGNLLEGGKLEERLAHSYDHINALYHAVHHMPVGFLERFGKAYEKAKDAARKAIEQPMPVAKHMLRSNPYKIEHQIDTPKHAKSMWAQWVPTVDDVMDGVQTRQGLVETVQAVAYMTAHAVTRQGFEPVYIKAVQEMIRTLRVELGSDLDAASAQTFVQTEAWCEHALESHKIAREWLRIDTGFGWDNFHLRGSYMRGAETARAAGALPYEEKKEVQFYAINDYERCCNSRGIVDPLLKGSALAPLMFEKAYCIADHLKPHPRTEYVGFADRIAAQKQKPEDMDGKRHEEVMKDAAKLLAEELKQLRKENAPSSKRQRKKQFASKQLSLPQEMTLLSRLERKLSLLQERSQATYLN